MSTAHPTKPILTLADLLKRLGGVPLDRIRFQPSPGTGTEQDVVELHDRENRLFELVEGVLVEKPMGFRESRIAAFLIRILDTFTEEHGLGIVAGADGMMRLAVGLVRIPDVSVVLWDRLPGRKVPSEPIPTLAPDLAVEVLSRSNTHAEIARKLEEYFAAGAQCAWVVDPDRKSVRVYDSPSQSEELTGGEMVGARSVMPGFEISVDEIFKRSGIE